MKRVVRWSTEGGWMDVMDVDDQPGGEDAVVIGRIYPTLNGCIPSLLLDGDEEMHLPPARSSYSEAVQAINEALAAEEEKHAHYAEQVAQAEEEYLRETYSHPLEPKFRALSRCAAEVQRCMREMVNATRQLDALRLEIEGEVKHLFSQEGEETTK